MVKTAEALGPDRYREEIIPELKTLLDDEDEVQLALAEELSKSTLQDQLGGAQHVPVILPHLEALLRVEDIKVRELAVKALLLHAPALPPEAFESTLTSLVFRLASSDYFSPKSSAIELIELVYPRASPESKAKLIEEFKKSTTHKTPMVRRSAAKSLKKLPSLVDAATLPLLLEDLKVLSSDDQDSVRLLVVEDCVSFASLLPEESKNNVIKPIVLACGNDKSWRVRYMVASLFTQLVDSLGQQITQTELVPIFVQLLRDTEAEVRTAASSKVSGVSKLLERDTVIKELLPCVRVLSADESSSVRSSLASDVMGLAPLFGKDGTNEHLLDIFLLLLRDETPEVRLNVIGKLDQVTQVLGLDQLSLHLLPAIIELAEDRQWRIRLSILEYIPLLAKQLGVQFFNEKLSNLTMSWLNDCVFSVREAATVNLQKLTESFGVEWSKEHLLPKIMEQLKHKNYLYRTTTLTMISAIATGFPPSDIQQHFLPPIFTLLGDPIANIRLNAAKALAALIARLETPCVQEVVIPFLKKRLEAEADRDVVYFSNLALQTASKRT
uniref:TOG domain-containing protein n=1 Tax=Arcella intermedia TaxID=1963864 RepID=A0A6B2L0J4_9EUKA